MTGVHNLKLVNSSKHCYYHNHKNAVDQCQKCHNLVCKDDITTFTPNPRAVVAYGIAIYLKYCLPCYYDYYIRREQHYLVRNYYAGILASFLIAVAGLFFLSAVPKMLQNSDVTALSLLVVIEIVTFATAVAILYITFRNKRNTPQKIHDLTDKKTNFMNQSN